jgi:outer membrane protein insertion porin family
VPGTQDQVDVTVKVEEQSAGSLQFGVGYSQYSGIILNASVSQNNLFGTGDSVSISGERSSYYTKFSVNYYNPYLTDNGHRYRLQRDLFQDRLRRYRFRRLLDQSKSFSSLPGHTDHRNRWLRVGLGISSNKVNTDSGLQPAGADRLPE